jgi:hypothetical protein
VLIASGMFRNLILPHSSDFLVLPGQVEARMRGTEEGTSKIVWRTFCALSCPSQ